MILYLAGIGQSIQDEMDLIENADSYNRLHSFLDGERVLQAIHYSEKLRAKGRKRKMVKSKKKKNKKDTSLSPVKPPYEIELEQIQEKVNSTLCQLKRNMYEIGKLLSRAKAIHLHGNFQKWLDESFGEELPYNTAYNYMRIYDEFSDRPDVVQMLPFNFLQTITSKEFPEVIRKLVVDNPEITKRSDIRKINHAYQDFKSGTISEKEFENDVQEELRKGQKIKNNSKGLDVREGNYVVNFSIGKTLNAFKTIERSIDSIEVVTNLGTVDTLEMKNMINGLSVEISHFVGGLNIFEACDHIIERLQEFKVLIRKHSNNKPLVTKDLKKRRHKAT